MIVNDLATMEKIVASNSSLSWDGWTVINSYKTDKARTSQYGLFKDGSWYMVRRFDSTRNGWDIPSKFVG
jgi:hypothetical protein